MDPTRAPDPAARPRLGLFFAHEWDAEGCARQTGVEWDPAGFDLFSFPSNVALAFYDPWRFVARQAERGRRRGWQGVNSQQEHFGALAAALVAERLGLPGNRPQAILAAQHKLYARQVLEQVAPEANLRFEPLQAAYGDDVPQGLAYPAFVKPVKAAFSVLARPVADRAALQAHTRFGRRELWVIRRLVEPFERVCRRLLPEAGTAHRMLLEEPVPPDTPQYNLDGWVWDGRVHALGVVDARMYPGTQAFMRWDLPGTLAPAVQARALDVARRFLHATGFREGFFNMEFFHDPATDRLAVIEFNPRLASQFSDLYLRVRGMDPHAMAVAMARGMDPGALPRRPALGGAAASLVYRSFDPSAVPAQPTPAMLARLREAFPHATVHGFPKQGHSLLRDFKWLGCTCYGIVHLHARDPRELREHALIVSRLLGWPAPYADAPTLAPAAPVAADPPPSPFPLPASLALSGGPAAAGGA